MASVEDPQALVGQIEQLLQQLYTDPNSQVKDVAQKSLIAFQNSLQAWSIAWHLLNHQVSTVQFFGANILHHKITHAWDELPQEQHELLRVQIFQALLKFADGARVVRTRLCLALAVFVLRMTPHEWPNCISSIIQTIRSSRQLGSSSTGLLLDILTVLPEEFESNPAAHLHARRGVIKGELKQGAPTVLALLSEVMDSAELAEDKIRAMKCFDGWIQFGLPVPDIFPLITHLFAALEDSDVCEQAVETLVEIAMHPDSEKYPEHMQQIMHKILQLYPLIQSKLKEGMEMGLGMCKVVVEFATVNRNLLLQGGEEGGGAGEGEGQDPAQLQSQEEALEMMQLVLEFTSLPGCYLVNEMCSETTLRFWTDILESMEVLDVPDQQRLCEFYQSILTGLVEALLCKAMYPAEDVWHDMTEDDRVNFKVYREDISDVATLLQTFVHIEFLDHLSKALGSALASPSPSWQHLEAILFLLQAASQSVHDGSYPYLQLVFAQFPRLPPHSTLSKTLLTFLGSFSSWLSHQPALLPSVVQSVFSALADPDLALLAAIAFRDICEECAEQLLSYINQLLPACESSLNTLSSRESVRIVAALGRILSVVSPPEISQLLQGMLTKQSSKLKELSSMECAQKNKAVVDREVQLVGALCTHVAPQLAEEEQHPLLPFVMEVWPYLKLLMVNWVDDEEIVDAICVCLIREVRSFDRQFSPLLGETADVLAQYVRAVRHPRVVDVATQLVQVFGEDEVQQEVVQALIHRLTDLCMELYRDGTLKRHPDMLQAFLGLLVRTLTLCPQHILSREEAGVNVFELGLEALQSAESNSVSGAGNLLASYISIMGRHLLAAQVVAKLGKELVLRILQGVGGAAPRSHLDPYLEVLLSLSRHCTEPLSQWLQELLSQDGFPTEKVTNLEKSHFISAILREVHNKRVLRNRISEFSLHCRGYHGIVS